ncbi:penicillin-binding protein 1A [Maritalea myrionectae]|uniref:Penicillin-binding protein 1A n=1 Tax=Maritalea myrionectae TaxID=454601 RepID=A0A2R4MEQ0_9HYPH|nr:penicillin-binding protein 1A [Maritalea myrionectae]AVX04517.1 penicillin-binding protein 1A [Maritalea myrionectae]
MLRILSWLFAFGFFTGLIALAGVGYFLWTISEDLPDYTVLKDYQPPVTTRVHAADGSLLGEYARERRLFQPIETIPPMVVNAFVAVEDKDFYSHGGLAFDGILRAVRDNIQKKIDGTGGPLVGASTITQQVARNFLLTLDQTWDRKIKEMLLAIRIEQTFSKDKIMELYLNEIFLGLNSYGISAAALNYFDKALYELTIAEAAYIAALPKGPANYHPIRYPKAAIERRNYVIGRMEAEGYISAEEAKAAQQEPLNVFPRTSGSQVYSAEYFAEEVRRRLARIYGEDQLYGGGLSVRTTMDPKLQSYARDALINGLVQFDQTKGYRGPVATIELDDDWGDDLAEMDILSDVPEWRLGVVIELEQNSAVVGLRPEKDLQGNLLAERETGQLPGKEQKWIAKPLSQILNVGDVIYVEQVPDNEGVYQMRQPPEVQGGLVAMDPRTGRVLALVGGFSFAESEFNRATQAERQPGSSFKPIVYAAALDNGYTPASVVLDAPLSIKNADGTSYQPDNYSREFYGPQTLRRGIERSRNVMTVRLAQDIGMPLVSEYSRLFGIHDNLPPYLAMALGAGETTVLRMTAAYATIANGGRKINPTLIDRVQDRYGNTVFKHDERICDGCAVEEWQNQAEPLVIDNRDQVLDPMTAYQITSMMEGVVQRGTGTRVRALGRPVAGKTGTTDDYKDAWFVGFTPNMAVGVYVGYDTPRNMGRNATGGELAAPIFRDFMENAMKGKPPTPFNIPGGMTPIWIDPKTGVKVAGGGEGAIVEAFKPGTGPNLITSVIGVDSDVFVDLEGGSQDFNAGRGGLF